MCKKNKKCAKYFKLYIFEKPLSRQIQIYKNICKILKPENVQNLFKVICAKIYAKFFRKNCAASFFARLSKEL